MQETFYVKSKKMMLLFIFIISLLACILMIRTKKVLAAVENELEITVNNANVILDISKDGKFHYKCQRSLYTVKRKIEDSITVINVKKRTGKLSKKAEKSFVEIFIPDKIYTKITGIVKKGGLSMPSINTNITIKNYSGAVSLNLPSGFDKKISYTGKNGSGSIVMDKDSKFMIDVEISDTALSTFWGGNSTGEAIYKYQQGSRKKQAKIKLNLKKCSFAIEER